MHYNPPLKPAADLDNFRVTVLIPLLCLSKLYLVFSVFQTDPLLLFYKFRFTVLRVT